MGMSSELRPNMGGLLHPCWPPPTQEGRAWGFVQLSWSPAAFNNRFLPAADRAGMAELALLIPAPLFVVQLAYWG